MKIDSLFIRWRFRFSLRMLFVVMALVSIPMAYVGSQVRIVEQRQAAARDIINRGGQVWIGLSDLEEALLLDPLQGGWGQACAEMPFDTWPESPFQISWIREQLGDVPVFYVVVPEAEKATTKKVFPEAVVLSSERLRSAGVGSFAIQIMQPFEDRRPASWR